MQSKHRHACIFYSILLNLETNIRKHIDTSAGQIQRNGVRMCLNFGSTSFLPYGAENSTQDVIGRLFPFVCGFIRSRYMKHECLLSFLIYLL